MTYCTSGPLKFPSNYVLCLEISYKYWFGIFLGISLPEVLVRSCEDGKSQAEAAEC